MRVGAAGDKGLLFSLSPPHQGSDKSGVIVYRWKRSWQQAQHRPHQLEGEVELLPARSATRKRRRAAAGAKCQLPRTSPTTIWKLVKTPKKNSPSLVECLRDQYCIHWTLNMEPSGKFVVFYDQIVHNCGSTGK